MFLSIRITTLLLATGAMAADSKPKTNVPRTWVDTAIAAHEIPLANPAASPKHVSAEYYYRIPVRPIYKSYPIYAPGYEPPGYMEWLKQREPVILWDDKAHRPRLETEEDWRRAGEIVFDAPIAFSSTGLLEDVRNADWYKKLQIPVPKSGILPEHQYVIRTKGVVEVGSISCAHCHSRVMPDGTVVKGAQSTFPVNRAAAWRFRAEAAAAPDKQKYLAQLRGRVSELHGAPWLRPDMQARIDSMSAEEIASVFDVVPAGASLRARANSFLPIQVPDLIGVKDRRYLDRTGLEVHRDIGDLMRYAAMNQGGDRLASFGGFVPADIPGFSKVPPPESRRRYSDEQLYALALWIYSLKPPPNPNRLDAIALKGKKVFERERCGMCHTPPLYTNNKLTPVKGFKVPEEHRQRYDILPVSVGTDPDLALRTRRGTGYYKVPSLKGLWYRGMFPHDGSCATLEDWFDPRRLRDDYVPTGFKGYGVEKRAVPGHQFGLHLNTEEKSALLAFLRTL
jgi:hypothetical protein